MLKSLQNYNDRNSLGSRFRMRRAAHVRRLIRASFEETGGCRMIDVGGTESYWSNIGLNFLEAHNVHITLLNRTQSDVQSTIFTAVAGDGCRADFPSKSFDVVHSNSVIEHVGSWDRIQEFAGEVRRLGRRYYVQTPNFWFPMEPHFGLPLFHWLPFPARVSLVQRFALGYFERTPEIDHAIRAVESVNLLDAKMMRFLFPDAEIMFETVAGLRKSVMALRD